MKTESLILGIATFVGMSITTVLTAKATLKAKKTVEEYRRESGDEDPLSAKDLVKLCYKDYIPPALAFLGTTICIAGNTMLNCKQTAVLASTYGVANEAVKEYKERVELPTHHPEVPDGECLFFDMESMQYFHAPMSKVMSKTVMSDGLECYIIETPAMEEMLPCHF